MTKISRQEAGRMGQAKSAPIWQAAKQARITEYTLNPSKCAACGKALEYSQRHNKFCTMSCSASVNNLNNRRHGDDPGNCLNCENRLGASRLTYCSTGCHRGYEWKCFVAKIDKADTIVNITLKINHNISSLKIRVRLSLLRHSPEGDGGISIVGT